MSLPDIAYWLAFSRVWSIGPQRFSLLQKKFSTIEEAWQAPKTALLEAGLDEKVISEIETARQALNLGAELERLEKEGVFVVTIKDENYPALLKEIYSPPYILYCRGRLPKPGDFLLAVVGTRKCTQYGEQVADELSRHLAAQNAVIVSGLALGIDSIAHHAALDAGGRTIAVLAAGIEKMNIYPSSNRQLAEQMVAQGGAVLSEHPLGTPPLKHHFPRRNRLIAGLSLGTLVIEAPEKSGALLTARHALEENREVFAVPGNITNPNAAGTNNLIKMGARLVSSAPDIIDALNIKAAIAPEMIKIIPDTPEEARILEHLTREPLHANELTHLTGLNISLINSTLTLMEMKGKVRHLGGLRYVRAR